MNSPDQDKQAGGVAGDWHSARRKWLVIVWLGYAATQLYLAVSNFRERHPWGVALTLLATGVGIAMSVIALLEGTVIEPDGVRVRRGMRWRRLSWKQVRSINHPGRWQQQQTLSLTTTTGDTLITHVPTALHSELEQYAAAHREP